MTDFLIGKHTLAGGVFFEFAPMTDKARAWISANMPRAESARLAFNSKDALSVAISLMADGITMQPE